MVWKETLPEFGQTLTFCRDLVVNVEHTFVALEDTCVFPVFVFFRVDGH